MSDTSLYPSPTGRPSAHRPTGDPFREYAWGTDAARIFGVADAASVWRQIARHKGDYPGKIEVVELGRRKMVRRDDLEAFTRWYDAGPGQYGGKRKPAIGETAAAEKPTAAAGGVGRAAVTDERRAALRRAIAELTL
jgi:hypothetical protein